MDPSPSNGLHIMSSGGLIVKQSPPANAGATEDTSLDPQVEKIPREKENGNPL